MSWFFYLEHVYSQEIRSDYESAGQLLKSSSYLNLGVNPHAIRTI